jgi:hypothetical protein
LAIMAIFVIRGFEYAMLVATTTSVVLRSAREQHGMDAIDRADGLEHDDLGLAGRRSVVVDTRGRRLVEDEGRASRGTTRIGEETDLEAGHVGDRPGRSDRACVLVRKHGRRDSRRARERSDELTAHHVSSTPWSASGIPLDTIARKPEVADVPLNVPLWPYVIE